jgi:hypothetical protein
MARRRHMPTMPAQGSPALGSAGHVTNLTLAGSTEPGNINSVSPLTVGRRMYGALAKRLPG